MVSDPLVTSGHWLASGCWRLLPVASSPCCVWCWTENLCAIALITSRLLLSPGVFMQDANLSTNYSPSSSETEESNCNYKQRTFTKTFCPSVAKGTTFSLKTDKLKSQFATSNSAVGNKKKEIRGWHFNLLPEHPYAPFNRDIYK